MKDKEHGIYTVIFPECQQPHKQGSGTVCYISVYQQLVNNRETCR